MSIYPLFSFSLTLQSKFDAGYIVFLISRRSTANLSLSLLLKLVKRPEPAWSSCCAEPMFCCARAPRLPKEPAMGDTEEKGPSRRSMLMKLPALERKPFHAFWRALMR